MSGLQVNQRRRCKNVILVRGGNRRWRLPYCRAMGIRRSAEDSVATRETTSLIEG
jgi:hypothetical protein